MCLEIALGKFRYMSGVQWIHFRYESGVTTGARRRTLLLPPTRSACAAGLAIYLGLNAERSVCSVAMLLPIERARQLTLPCSFVKGGV